MVKKAKPDVEERVDSLVDWLELHSRQLMYGSIGLLVVAGGFWFYKQSTDRQAQSASMALSEAESAIAAGNLPLAQSDLEIEALDARCEQLRSQGRFPAPHGNMPAMPWPLF